MRKIVTLLSLVIISCATSAEAAVVTFQQGVNGYTGTRDTELRFIDPDLNSGSAESISIDYDDGPGSVNPTHGLMKFEGIIGNGPGQIPLAATINSATLTFRINSVGSGWNYHRMLIDWDEMAATWNSLGAGVQADDIEAVSSATYSAGAGDGNGNIVGDQLDGKGLHVVTDLAADLQAWVNGSSNYGWAILPFVGGTNGIDIDSSEATEFGNIKPLLTVDYSPVPEPHSIALLLTGAVLLGGTLRWRNRKRA